MAEVEVECLAEREFGGLVELQDDFAGLLVDVKEGHYDTVGLGVVDDGCLEIASRTEHRNVARMGNSELPNLRPEL